MEYSPEKPVAAPVNLAIPWDQAWQMVADVERLLVPFVLLLCVHLVGCSAKVEMESAGWESSPSQVPTSEKVRTVVELNLGESRSSEPAAFSKQPASPPAKAVASEINPVAISGNTLIVNIRGGDTYLYNETHIHVHEPPMPKVEERIVVQREVRVEPPRRADDRCEQMAREHEARVEMWKRFPGHH